MTRRFLTMAVILALAAVCFIPSSLAAETMYVYTSNGGSLNIRSDPYVDENVIGTLPYGSAINVEFFLGNGWACVDWGGTEAYVQSRFLQGDPPGPQPQPRPRPKPTAEPSGSSSIETLNAEFRTARLVNPYTVYARPTRASGWVNLRWAPSMETEVIATYHTGDPLTVVAELRNWYQVEDPDTGATGFMMKKYVSAGY